MTLTGTPLVWPEVAHLSKDGSIFWRCPACDSLHRVIVRGYGNEEGHCWGWNGSLLVPTFTPSVNVKWPTWKRDGSSKVDNVCHSHVTDGVMHYCGDCTHAMAGQSAKLQPFDW